MPLNRTFRSLSVLVLSALVLGQATVASAYCLYLTSSDGLFVYWLIVCNDGFSILSPTESVSGTMQLAGNICGTHGGVAEVSETGAEAARSAIEASDPPSTVTFARMGPTGYEALTLDDLEALAAGAEGEAVELTGYVMASVKVGQTELLSSPIGGLTGIPLLEIWVNDDDTGPPVGGSTVIAVPVGGGVGVWMALLLLSTGVSELRRRVGK